MKQLLAILSAFLLISTCSAHASLVFESEPNNTLATADKTQGTAFLEATGQLDPNGGDVDLFSFEVLATGKIELAVFAGLGEPEPLAQLVSVTLKLIDASGTILRFLTPVTQTGGGFGFIYGPPYSPALTPGIYYVEIASLATTGPDDQYYYLQISGDRLPGGAKITGIATPEPSSLASAVLAVLAGLGFVRRRTVRS